MSGLFPYLPVFLDLAGRGAVLLSGAPALVRIARTFLDAGAAVTVIDADISPARAELGPAARLLPRRWRAADLTGAALVVAGPGEPRAGAARQAARSVGAFFAMVGDPDHSEVIFGATAAWGPVAIGVTASGLAPGLGEAMARRLEAAVPPGYAGFLAAAARQRDAVSAALPDAADREVFWRVASTQAFDASAEEIENGWDAWLLTRLASV